jgi:hypothetical protein
MINPHCARHVYARVAEARSMHIRQIAAGLGHSSVAVTDAHLADADILENSAAPLLADLITACDELTRTPTFADRRAVPADLRPDSETR